MAIKPLEINSKILKLMKPVTSADYTEKTVLTNSSWEYVELWLKRKNSDKSKQALFYWLQAKNFFNASECLPIESRPLTAYYCCLNAAKALLAIRGTNSIAFRCAGRRFASSIDLLSIAKRVAENGRYDEYCIYRNSTAN